MANAQPSYGNNYNPMGYVSTPVPPSSGGTVQTPLQYSYGNITNPMMNTYDNFLNNRYVQQQNLVNQYLKCRPVSSKEEARAFQIDLDGSLWVFTDVGNQKIYTKQINNDGTATFKTYQLTVENNDTQMANNEYVTKAEFNSVVEKLVAAIQLQRSAQPVPTTEKTEEKKPLLNF